MDKYSQTSRFDYTVRVEGPLVNEIHDSARQVWSRVAWTRLRISRSLENGRPFPSAETKGRMHAAFLIRNKHPPSP